LVQGVPSETKFEIIAKLGSHPTTPNLVRVDPRHGKRSRTLVEVAETFRGWALLKCTPLTHRAYQMHAHLRHAGLPLVGAEGYGGRPLWLSRLKKNYHLKEGDTERPLIGRAALHAAGLTLPHPVTGEILTITAPWPKDLAVGVKYLRRFAVT
jgi:23S rRNA pseudouridine955/2504/2580 synthase